MHFSWPNLWYLLAAFALFGLLSRARRRPYYGHSLLSYLAEHVGPPPLWTYLPRALELGGALCLGIALLDPVIPMVDRAVENQGLNIVLVVDLSSSMQMPVTGGHVSPEGRHETRLEAVKAAMVDFIHRRKSDRIGVVVFSNNAYVVTPMTLDYKYLVNYIEMINERTLSDEGMTAIGEGLLQARDMLSKAAVDGSRRGNVIVLLTDGENNTGRPVDYALQEVNQAQIRTYFIGVEVEMGATVQNQGFNDAPRLVAGVQATGGRYFDARDVKQLNQAYREIALLEKGKFQTREQSRDVPAFQPFAIAALVGLGAGLVLRASPAFRDLS